MFKALFHWPTVILKFGVALVICSLTIPFAQAHAGHHAHEQEVTKANGGDFTLTSVKGPASLSDFRGKMVVIYFGYSHCTDTCPLDLGKLGSALKSMKSVDSEQIQPLFITLDPARDDAAHMATYCASFHPRLIGLTGTDAEIAAVTKAYGLHYKKGKVNAEGNYDFDHPSVIYLVGRNGELLRHLPIASTPSSVAATLHQAVKQTKS